MCVSLRFVRCDGCTVGLRAAPGYPLSVNLSFDPARGSDGRPAQNQRLASRFWC
jgi:hypothetical protein